VDEPRDFAGLNQNDTVIADDAAWFVGLELDDLHRLRRRGAGPVCQRLGRNAIFYRLGDLIHWQATVGVQKV